MQLYYTPLSHFSRKVRILLDLYSVEHQLINIGNVAVTDESAFKGNPLMKIPVLVDGARWVLDSENICRYVVRKYDPEDRYGVLSEELFDMNARAVLDGAMAEEVKLVLAKRTGLPVEQYAFFDKARAGISKSLKWLEENVSAFNSKKPGFKEFHLVCFWEHLGHYKLVELNYPRLEGLVREVSAIPEIKKSSPLVNS
jgi:glutathione S-transferase